VAAAGPLTNLLLAAICGVLLNVAIVLFMQVMPDGNAQISGFGRPVILMLDWGIKINVMLAIFNLLPIPPMDGSKVAISALPMPFAGWFMRLERYGFLPLMILFLIPATNHMIGSIVWPVSSVLRNLFVQLPSYLF